jgi:putative membrane protein
LLLAGFAFIRRGKIRFHRACMISAFVVSSVFLGCYLYYHAHVGVHRFGGHGLIRPVYFALLVSHTILAIVNLPLVLVTLSFALRRKYASHRRIARWTYPIWLYVSVTGVVVYLLLYVIYTPSS